MLQSFITEGRLNVVTYLSYNRSRLMDSGIGIPVATIKNLCKFYLPVTGVVSHGVYGLLYMRPDLVPPQSYISAEGLSNALLFQSALGVGSYLYNLEHMKHLPVARRAMFATYGTALFSFGTMFVYGSIKMGTERNALRLVLAFLASGALISIGKEFFDHINELTGENGKGP
uniref:Uncharacterized protein n=1 Tax=Trichuris muris TaxID=70415 RepID=A0A5S6R0P0_TRIMR